MYCVVKIHENFETSKQPKAILFMHFVNAHVGKYITQLIDGKRLKTN